MCEFKQLFKLLTVKVVTQIVILQLVGVFLCGTAWYLVRDSVLAPI